MKEIKKAQMGLIAVLAGIVLLVAAGSASAGCVGIDTGYDYRCGDTVTESCIFDGDMNCPPDTCGLIMGSDDIIIEGYNATDKIYYGIHGDRSGTNRHIYGIYNSHYNNVTIANLTVKRFNGGIGIKGDFDYGLCKNIIESNTIFNCTIRDNGRSDQKTHGILFVCACNSSITNCRVCNNTGWMDGGCGDGGNGILLFGESSYNDITCNEVYNNTLTGIYAKMKCMHNKVTHNTVCENGVITDLAYFGGGIRFQCKKSSFETIEDNIVTDNFGPGIFIGGNDCIVRNNTVTGSKNVNNGANGRGDGLRNDRATDGGGKRTQVYNNTFCDNEHIDINVESTDQGVTGDGNTCNTISNYDDAGTTGCTYDCVASEMGCVASDGTVFGCGDTVTKSCTFNCDLNCQTGYGLVIGADNITIDGAGHALERADPGECVFSPSIGIYNKAYDDVVVTNLEIRRFCTGIYLTHNSDTGDVIYRNMMDNCSIHHNGNATGGNLHGIAMKYVYNSTIRNNSIHDQIAYVDPNPGCEDGGNGLFLYQGEYNNIIGNKFYNNTKAGMLIKMKPKHWNISHNHLWGNGQGGIILRCKLCDFNLIEHNNASDNYGSGIFIGGNDNIIRYNTVCNNKDGGPYYDDSVGGHGYGIHIGRGDGSLDNTLISNTVCGNDCLDIRVVTGVTGNTGDENTCNTTLNYDDAGTTGCMYSCDMQQPLGDLNDDGVITPADAVIALQIAVRGEYSADADVSGDHRVTSLDALMIMQTAAGL